MLVPALCVRVGLRRVFDWIKDVNVLLLLPVGLHAIPRLGLLNFLTQGIPYDGVVAGSNLSCPDLLLCYGR